MNNSDNTSNQMEPRNVVKLLAVLAVLAVLALAAFFYWMFFAGGDIKMAEPSMQQAENKVAEDAVQQYYIAERQGDKMQIYTQASFAAAAFLQAKDEPNYRYWKSKEDSLARVLHLR
jgi:flagellar basal body-associated protein FliL